MNYRSAVLLSIILTYGGTIVTCLGLTAFILGTGDFGEWGQNGRFGAVVFTAVALFIASMVLELERQRDRLIRFMTHDQN